jgi:hypothetical protein
MQVKRCQTNEHTLKSRLLDPTQFVFGLPDCYTRLNDVFRRVGVENNNET